MTELTPLTALGNIEPFRRSFGAIELEEVVSTGLASLSLPNSSVRALVSGLELPGPGKWASGGEISAFWTGPDQWMVEAQGQGNNDFAKALKSIVPQGAVTEQTDGWAIFEIRSNSGEQALNGVMEKLFNIDLSRFGSGSATRTGLEHMSVFVVRKAPECLAVFGMRSAARSVWHALEAAARRASEKL